MSMDRREFLRIAGITTLAGIGAAAGVSGLGLIHNEVEASDFEPGPDALIGKRWGFVVDMSKFKTDEDYKRVKQACHSIHNVPDFGDPKHEIKWIWTDTYEHVFPGNEDKYMAREMPFVVLCNHCDHPPCVRVCPTKATFKRKDGIVMMDMHRCIGCRFCMAACPFGARSFNFTDPRPFIKEPNPEFPTRTKGVVEKCTLCYERLAKGLKPACAEKSNGGIVFGDLEDPNSEVRQLISTHYTIRRRAELGTQPSIYYIVGGSKNA
jgi:molybdopterin-containing oxidoreductase family iron-sulfur binding subunit